MAIEPVKAAVACMNRANKERGIHHQSGGTNVGGRKISTQVHWDNVTKA